MGIPKKILMLHNRYQYRGGEDTCTEAEIEILRQAGHEVTLIEKNNQQIKEFSQSQKLQLFFTTAWNSLEANEMRSRFQEIKPDLLHVQNFFPLFSPSVHGAAKSLNIPTIQHLHNFRLGCLNAYLFREGKICKACLGKNPWRGIVYGCYRNSRPASLAVWNMITYNRWRGTWLRDVDGFIAPSRFTANKLVEIGIPGHRLYVKPNVTTDPLGDKPISPLPSAPTFLFLGRLSPEKGVMTLFKAWEILAEPSWQLAIVGDGPQKLELEQFVQERQLTNVNFFGYQGADGVLKAIENATAVVVPSQCYETFGRVVIEAFACGRGVLVSDLGALAELVEEGETGFLVSASDPHAWAERLKWCGDRPQQMARMGKKCRQVYLDNYTPAVNYQQMMEIYQQLTIDD